MSHAHHHAGPDRRRPLTIVLLLTSGYLTAEVIAGWLTHSLALLADAGHMLTDVAGLGLALTAMTFAARPATPDRTYGYYRFEILASVVNAVVLLLISFLILYEAYQRFRHPPEIASGPVLAVAVIGLIINLIGARSLRGGVSLTSGRNALSVHLVREAETPHDDLLVRAQRLLTGELHFWHVTIQVESTDCEAYETHL
jgi:Co/Zn/Cd efflux system component